MLFAALGASLRTTTSASALGSELELIRISILSIPEGLGWGSTAVPDRTRRFVVDVNPLGGEVMLTTGAVVSGKPPGAIRTLSVPVEFVFTLATAIL